MKVIDGLAVAMVASSRFIVADTNVLTMAFGKIVTKIALKYESVFEVFKVFIETVKKSAMEVSGLVVAVSRLAALKKIGTESSHLANIKKFLKSSFKRFFAVIKYAITLR